MLEFLLNFLLTIIRSPEYMSLVCAGFIIYYYILTYFFIKNAAREDGIWKRNGIFDIFTSVCSFTISSLLIWSLIELTYKNELSLSYLISYYFIFIFLFAFLYNLLEWHFDNMLENVQRDSPEAPWQYVLISIQTQTTLGYTRVRPAHFWTEFIAALQALLGLFFAIIFIAKAVNKLK